MTEDDYMTEISEKYITEGVYAGGISELDSRKTPKQLDAPVFIHEMEGSKGIARKISIEKVYNVDAVNRDFPAELGDGKREM